MVAVRNTTLLLIKANRLEVLAVEFEPPCYLCVCRNWKLEGQASTAMHNPGSPRRAKLARYVSAFTGSSSRYHNLQYLHYSLKKSGLAPPSSGGGDVGPPPASPVGQSTEGTQSLNHLGGGNRVEDFSGSPRKKPRKQNV